MIPWNINKRKTNTLITITRKTVTKDESNNYIYCNKCNIILGFELKKSDEDMDNDDNKNNNIFYLLKKNIKERNNRNVNINLISFKENLLKTIKEEFDNIFKDIKNINIQINLTPLSKQNFEEFSKFYKKKEFDFTFIIHKMEGRIFLLGKNGYFNAVENCLIKKENSNLFFILISNEVDDAENKKIIEELIYQGEEERLEKYYKNNRIIFLDNFQIKKSKLHQNKGEGYLNFYRKADQNYILNLGNETNSSRITGYLTLKDGEYMDDYLECNFTFTLEDIKIVDLKNESINIILYDVPISYSWEEYIDSGKTIHLNHSFINLTFYKNYRQFQDYIECEKNIYVADKRKIDNMIEYLNNKEKGLHTGCFS